MHVVKEALKHAKVEVAIVFGDSEGLKFPHMMTRWSLQDQISYKE